LQIERKFLKTEYFDLHNTLVGGKKKENISWGVHRCKQKAVLEISETQKVMNSSILG
jgi:hypothetical protein